MGRNITSDHTRTSCLSRISRQYYHISHIEQFQQVDLYSIETLMKTLLSQLQDLLALSSPLLRRLSTVWLEGVEDIVVV